METEEKRGPGRPKADKLITVKLHKGYWPEGRNEITTVKGKVNADEIVDLPADEAKRVCHELKIGEVVDRSWFSEN